MKQHAFSLRSFSDFGAFAFKFPTLDKLFPAQAWQAKSLEDFVLAMGMMKTAARETRGSIDPQITGRFLSLLENGGSGPETGCVVVARNAKGPAGFALLRAKPGQHLEVAWLHVKESSSSDDVVDCIWEEIVRIQNKWGYRVLYTGGYAPLPNDAYAAANVH